MRDEAQVLVQPVERLVEPPAAPRREGQPPQRLVQEIALRVARRHLGQDLGGARLVTGVGVELGHPDARVVGVAVVGVLRLDPRVTGEREVAVPRRGPRARPLVQRLGVQIAVAGLGADPVRLVEERRRARALPLLPDRLRAVEARLALQVGVQLGRPQGRGERRLRLLVAVVVEEDHPARHQRRRDVGAEERGLGGGEGGGELLQPVARPVAPGLERRLGPDAPVEIDDLLAGGLLLGRACLLHRLGLLVEHLGVARAAGEALEMRVDRRQRVVPADQRAERVDLDQIRFGLGDGARRDLGGPVDGASVVAAPQPAAGRVVGVVGGELGVTVVELLEQLPRVGPVRLVGPGQRQQVGGGAPLVAAAGQRLQRAGEPGLGSIPVVGAKLLRRLLGGAVLEEGLQPGVVEGDRLAGGVGWGSFDGGRLVVIAAGWLRERNAREGERERRRGDRRAARDGHKNRLRTARTTCKKEGPISRQKWRKVRFLASAGARDVGRSSARRTG